MRKKDLETKLKSKDLKVTLPRTKVLEVLYNSKERHLTAEKILTELDKLGENMAQATLYRVLAQFEEVELILKHRFSESQAVYEVNNLEHHDHLVCTKCNYIIEFSDLEIEALQEKIAAEHNFKIKSHTHYIYGICSNCQKLIEE